MFSVPERKPLVVKARNLTEACLIVENKLKEGEKYYKFATIVGERDENGLLEIMFSDEEFLNAS